MRYDIGAGAYDRSRASPPRSPRAAAGAVLRRAASPGGCGRGRRRAAAGRPRARQPGGRAAAARRRGARARRRRSPDAHGYAPFRGLPRLARGDRRPLPRRLRGRRSTRSARSRSSRGRRPRSSSWRWRSRSAATRSCSPTRTTRTTRRGSRSPGAAIGLRAARPGGGLAARPRARARRGRALPELPLESVRRLRRARHVRGGRRLRRAHRHARSFTTPPTSTSSSTGAAPGELPRDAGGEGGRGRDVVDVEELRHGRLADRVRARERRDRRAGQPARATTAGSGILAPLQQAAIAALEGPQDERRGAAGHLRAPPRPARRGAARAAGLRGNVLRLAAAARGADRRAAARGAPRGASRRARGSGRAAPAGRGSRSPSPTRRSQAGIERLVPALAAAYA